MRPRFAGRLPRSGGGDGVMRVREGVVERLLHVGPCPVRVRAWHVRTGIRIRAERVEPRHSIHFDHSFECEAAGREHLELAIDRIRFALAIDDDMSDFFETFKADPLIGPVIHRRPGSARGAGPGRGRRSRGRSPSS